MSSNRIMEYSMPCIRPRGGALYAVVNSVACSCTDGAIEGDRTSHLFVR